MKKLLVALISLTLLCSSFITFAGEGTEKELTESINIISTEKSEELENYASGIVNRSMERVMMAPERHGFNEYEASKFDLGEGFNIYQYEEGVITSTDIFYFPLMFEKNVKGFLAVTYDNDTNAYITTLSNTMAGTFNDLKNLNDAFMIVDAYGHIFAVNDKECILLEEGYNSLKTAEEAKQDLESYDNGISDKAKSVNTLALKKTINIEPETMAVSARSHIISDSISISSVLQGDKPWCGAAATAAIINYRNGSSLTAEDVTIEVHGSAKEEGITNSEVVDVASNHGLSASKTSPLSYNSVAYEIGKGNPIYMQMQRTDSAGDKHYHALILRGYENYVNYGEKIYSVINPWYSYYVEISGQDSGSQVKYITGSRTYTWYKTIKGFTK